MPLTHKTFFKSDLTTRVASKDKARKDEEALKRAVYKAVDQRDERLCRACGRRCRVTLECVPDRLEHHHITFRSQQGAHSTENVLTLDLDCHSKVTTNRMFVRGNADQLVTFEEGDRSWQG